MNNPLDKLQKQMSFSKAILIILGILEIPLALLFAYFNKQQQSDQILVAMIAIAIIYIVFVGIRLYQTKVFGQNIHEELKYKDKVEALQEDNDRLQNLSSVQVELMKNLNEQTCRLDNGQEQDLCDTGIEASLKNLMVPVTETAYYLLSGKKYDKFTHGLFLAGYSSMALGVQDSGTIIFEDGLLLKEKLPKNILSRDDLNQVSLQIQTAIRSSYQNKRFEVNQLTDSESNLEIICS